MKFKIVAWKWVCACMEKRNEGGGERETLVTILFLLLKKNKKSHKDF